MLKKIISNFKGGDSMFAVWLNEFPFVWQAIALFLIVGAVGVVREGFWLGAGIGLSISLVFMAAIWCGTYAFLFVMFWFDKITEN